MRAASSNLTLLRAAAAIAVEDIEMTIAAPLDRLPHFNPDLDDPELDASAPPEAVRVWRREIAEAAGVYICSPEYAFGIPGPLKNALDWLVPSGELYRKPTALITASPNYGGAQHAQAHLRDTLRAQHAHLLEAACVSVPMVRTRFAADGSLTDAGLRAELEAGLKSLAEAARQALLESTAGVT